MRNIIVHFLLYAYAMFHTLSMDTRQKEMLFDLWQSTDRTNQHEIALNGFNNIKQ